MIAKVNFDGKERVAILLGEYSDFQLVQSMLNALNNCIQAAQSEDLEMNKDSSYYLHELINEMLPTPEQAFDMFGAYFNNEKTETRPKLAKSHECKIFF